MYNIDLAKSSKIWKMMTNPEAVVFSMKMICFIRHPVKVYCHERTEKSA